MIQALYDRPSLDLNGTWKYKLDQNDVGKRQSYYLESNKFDAWRDIAVPHNWYLVDDHLELVKAIEQRNKSVVTCLNQRHIQLMKDTQVLMQQMD